MSDASKTGRGNRQRYDDREILQEIALYISLGNEPYVKNGEENFTVALNEVLKSVPGSDRLSPEQYRQLNDRILRKFKKNRGALLDEAKNRRPTLWGAPPFSTLLTAPDLPDVAEALKLLEELTASMNSSAAKLQKLNLHSMTQREREGLIRSIREVSKALKLLPD